MLDDDPSLLPADIAASATRMGTLVDEMRTALNELREATRNCPAASSPLITAKSALSGLSSECINLKGLIKVGRLPQVAVVEPAFIQAEELDLHPRSEAQQRERRLFMRTLHAAGDHTLDEEGDD
jgi:hypothetical protein